MFPIRFDFPFRKANGDLSTIGAEISAGGGGGYTLPTASAETKGGIKVGAGLSMEGETLVNNNPTPATPYTLPTASAETLGGVKVGSNLSIDENGVLSSNSGGGSTYTHIITIPCNGGFIYTTVVNNTSTPFTFANFCKWLYDNTIANYPASGYEKLGSNPTTCYPIVRISRGTTTMLYYTVISPTDYENKSANSSISGFNDKVVQN